MDAETLQMAALALRERYPDDDDFAEAMARLDAHAGGRELSAAGEDADDEDDGGRALADFYAAAATALLAAGADPAAVLDGAAEELEGTGWAVVRQGDRYLAADESAEEEDADGAEEMTLSLEGWTLAATHAIGETWQGGSGRWFTKRRDGRVVPARDPNKKALPGSAKQRAAARHAAGPADRAALAGRLGRHAAPAAGGGEGGAEAPQANAYQQGNAQRAAKALLRHHGEAAASRIEELADTLEDALGKVTGDDWRAERARRMLTARLSQLNATLAALDSPDLTQPRSKGKPAEPEYGRTYNVPTGSLKVDPTRFQYKLNTEAGTGVTQELKSVREWNPDFAGVLAVWQDPADGKTYVVNGHHRHELAGRLGAENLAVRYVKAGSAKEARAVGALINIAEGRGTAVDAAKFMRDSGVGVEDLEKRGVSLKGKVAADAAALTRLSDRQFDRLARGLLEQDKALAVARHLPDHDLQDQLFGLLDKREEEGKDLSMKVVEEMAREMAETPKTTKTEKSLFGDIESTESLFVPRNEVKAYVRGELAREVGDFMAVASKRRAERVGGAGNVLDVEKNREIAAEAERAKNTFDQLVNSRGAVSDAVNEAAAAYAKATSRRERDAAKQRAVEAVRGAVRAELGGEAVGAGAGGGAGSGGGTAGGGAADAGAGQPERRGAESAGLKPAPEAPPAPSPGGGLFGDPAPANPAADLFTGQPYVPQERTAEEKAVSAVGSRLNAMARRGEDRGELDGFPVERLPGSKNGMWSVVIGGKRYEGDQTQVANWIHAAKGKAAPGAAAAALPDDVQQQLRWAVGRYADYQRAVEQGRSLDRQFNAGGRYEREVRDKYPASHFAEADAKIALFRELAAENGVDADAALADLGYTPEMAGGRAAPAPAAPAPQAAAPEAARPTPARVESSARPGAAESPRIGRIKPVEPIVFDRPVVGPTGAKLLSYEWKYEPHEEYNERTGETTERRVSDWDRAEANIETGRGVVHHFVVRTPDGKDQVVSLETALKMLGYGDGKSAANVKGLASSVKTLAKLRMELQINKARKEAYDAALADAKAKAGGMKPPPVTEEVFGNGASVRYRMGDAWVGDLSGAGRISPERLRTLEERWRYKRVEELMPEDVRKLDEGGLLGERIRRLEARAAQAQAKVGAGAAPAKNDGPATPAASAGSAESAHDAFQAAGKAFAGGTGTAQALAKYRAAAESLKSALSGMGKDDLLAYAAARFGEAGARPYRKMDERKLRKEMAAHVDRVVAGSMRALE